MLRGGYGNAIYNLGDPVHPTTKMAFFWCSWHSNFNASLDYRHGFRGGLLRKGTWSATTEAKSLLPRRAGKRKTWLLVLFLHDWEGGSTGVSLFSNDFGVNSFFHNVLFFNPKLFNWSMEVTLAARMPLKWAAHWPHSETFLGRDATTGAHLAKQKLWTKLFSMSIWCLCVGVKFDPDLPQLWGTAACKNWKVILR